MRLLEEDYCEKQKNLRGAGLSTSQVSSKKSLEKKDCGNKTSFVSMNDTLPLTISLLST